MKTHLKFSALLVASLFVLSMAASFAGDDPVFRKESSSSLKQSESQRNKAATKASKAKSSERSLRLSATDWRKSYYSRIYERPWWPGAPGG